MSEEQADSPKRGWLQQQVAALIEDARERYAAWAVDGGLPFATSAERVHVGPHLRPFKAEAVVVPENASWRYLGTWRLDEMWRSRAVEIAGHAADEFADTLPFPERAYASFAATLLNWPPARFDFASDPPRWLLENAIVPAAMHYIRSLDSAEQGDPDHASAIAAEVITRMSSGFQGTRLSIAVAGVETPGTVSTSGLSLRPLSPPERGDLLKQTTGQHLGGLRPLAAAYLKGDLPTHLLEADEWHSNDLPHAESHMVQPQTLLAAFALHGYWLGGVGAYSMTFLPEWGISGASGGPTPMAPWATEVKVVAKTELNEVSATLAKLRTFDLQDPRNSQDLALHRFGLGCTRDEPADGLVDLVVALEALLLPYDEVSMRSDLSFRFRLHGALWIEGEREREATWKQLNEVYGVRSSLVHGSKYPARRTVAEQFRIARDLAAQGLLRAVRQGFPDPARFRALALN